MKTTDYNFAWDELAALQAGLEPYCSKEMSDLEADLEAAKKAAEKDGKKGYEIADVIISTYRIHRNIAEIHELAIDETTIPNVLTLFGDVTLTTGETLRFASYIDKE